ncbi:UDP-3-O-(3-hydroxymyristoyl)glucosamine N-acyltransferase [Alteromonas oceanisediminis]|uniref:UDP-3-O-(3-hydroxymyristoyl)glucosamine N-acyltransferase n=1 Tax=Alteromonas oceanisediminis TaxID=2836180 RepID=UPI001BD9ACCC|nr:UDP-3-O-(3-hydroxymyristoyl)glucosamine N-acyltransferase [Alteromonas oceanisediminis]MBT0585812.1 UDP-3-O-(3-hydroxymyristoyl)glucosamine N-acyltransferase [Alteromonas oceanisediminis]
MQDFSIAHIAEKLDAKAVGDEAFLQQRISGIGTLASAQPHHLSFFTNVKYKSDLVDTQAGAILIAPDHQDLVGEKALVVKNPHAAFARVAQWFDVTPAIARGVAGSASIDPSVRLGDNVSIGHNAVIAAGVFLGDNVQIGANTVIGENTVVEADSKIHPNVTIYHNIRIGSRVVIHSNSIIGADGFGYANDRGQWLPIPQIGRVVIGDETHIGAGTTIDRGALEDTIIGKNVIIDDQVHVGHNSEIGDHSCICGTTGIAGSCKIGKYVIIGGGCGINGHISIADKTQITAFSMVTSDIKEAGVYSSGQPATLNRDWRKNTIRVRQLDDLFGRVKALEKRVISEK